MKKGVFENFAKLTRDRVSFLIKLQVAPCYFIKKETLAPVFSCKFCEEHLLHRAPLKDCFYNTWINSTHKISLTPFVDDIFKTNIFLLMWKIKLFSHEKIVIVQVNVNR